VNFFLKPQMSCGLTFTCRSLISFDISSSGLGRLNVKTSPSDDKAAKVEALDVTFLIIGLLVRCGGRYPNPPLRGTGKLVVSFSPKIVDVDLHNLEIDIVVEADDLERIYKTDHGVVLFISIRYMSNGNHVP
jgi:hypothetical protein